MQTPSTNLRNRVTKLHLPKTKPLLPLFEIVSNSIHAIEEKKHLKNAGLISIKAIRNGEEETLKQVSEIERYPINSFEIIDNGIGLNHENFASFLEFDSEKKMEIGGKGIGRLVCLKAFNKLLIESIYEDDNTFRHRRFEYKKSKEGFDKYIDEGTEKKKTGTKVILNEYENDFQKQVPYSLWDIARQIINHFQLYYIQGKEPQIVIKNQDDTEINLTSLFNKEFEKQILEADFYVNGSRFTVYITKSYKAKSHKLHFCAHERAVKEEGLSKYISDLKNIVRANDGEDYYFQVFVVGDFLNRNVNEERTSFNFLIEDESEELDASEISLAKIRRETISVIENLLSEFLGKIRKEKLDVYLPIIEKEFPNYNSVINFNKDKVEKIPAGLNKNELDIKLYEIETAWKIKAKKMG